ncbi:MAG: hypothetical protein UY30_C0010G0009 [Parcubacteria group bacterium GW2011_GWB1_48_6]|nr:MAG: hypothetical protein UY30_C0010G0009 [Parcubacteria group bacterium GW2011_GWB1_48_6]
MKELIVVFTFLIVFLGVCIYTVRKGGGPP